MIEKPRLFSSSVGIAREHYAVRWASKVGYQGRHQDYRIDQRWAVKPNTTPMKKRKQKAIRAPRIPKAPDPIVSAQPNLRELKAPQARRLGMSALNATNATDGTNIADALSPDRINSLNTTNPDTSAPNSLDNIKSIILSSPNLSTAYQTLRRHRVKSTTFNVNSIQSYPELIAALEAKAVQITLGANIIAPDNILINHDVAINFNGYNIISEETNPGARVFDIRSGEVTLTGKGKIFAMGARSCAIRVFGAISIGMPAYTTLTIDDGISLFAPDSYGILISPNLGVAYGLVINLSGEIIARDGIGLSSHIRGRDVNLPTINIRSGARITADEIFGSALEAAGYASWNIGAAKLTGATGALLKSGQINFSHTEIIATGAAYSQTTTVPAAENAPETPPEDPAPANAAIRIASAAKHDLNITVEGGSYLGEKSFAIAGDPSSLESFVIKGGDFSGALDVLHYAIEPELEIEEGSFSLHPALHLKILKPEIVLLPEPEPEPYPKEVIEAMRPVLESADEPNPDDVIETVQAPSPLQKLPMPPTYDEAECAEKIAMTKALADAIIEMKNLKSSDYEVGFADLESAIRSAEQLLSAKIITLAAIRDASAKLLSAFDNLEERDEFSLTDDELDELFYHGAVLDELAADLEPSAKPSASEPTSSQSTIPNQNAPVVASQKTDQPTDQALVQQVSNPAPIAPIPQPVKVTGSQPASTDATPDFSTLASIIAQISALNPSDYAPAAYNILLSELVRVKPLLASATQPQIDAAVQSLSILLANLTQPTSLSHYFIDEMVPTRNWSTGVTAIDESDPHLCISRPLPKSLRRQFRLDFSPVTSFVKSFSAALRAGFDVYQKTRRIAKS